MFKKVLPVFVVLSFIVAAIGATAGVAFAAGINLPANATTISSTAFGREGFFSHNAAFAGDVAVSKFTPRDVRGLSGVKFIRQILALEPAANMKKGDKLAGPAYAFFDLTKGLVKAFRDKALKIYYLSPKSNTWTALRTSLINGKNGERAAARVMGDGWYALGITQ
jgi:hypothetical protein